MGTSGEAEGLAQAGLNATESWGGQEPEWALDDRLVPERSEKGTLTTMTCPRL